jgi:hypothetical protein
MFDKKIVNLDSVCDGYSRMNDLEVYLNETGNGVEDSARFWMRIWGLSSFEQFKSLIEVDRIKKFTETNKMFIDSIREYTIDFDWECEFLHKEKKDYSELTKFFDEFEFDGKSSERIIEFLKTQHS